MKIVALDFETHYAPDYTLSKQTTQSYVRDPRFQTIGFSMKVNDGKTVWYTGDDVDKCIPPQTWWDDALLVAHNAQFDATILSHRYNIRPKMICCTMSMGRTLGLDYHSGASLGGMADALRHLDPGMPAKGNEVVKALGKRRKDFTPAELAAYGEYCRTDTEICYRLFNLMVGALPNNELRWQDTVIRMLTEPVFVLDEPLLRQELTRVQTHKAKLMQQLIEMLGVGTEAKLQEHLGSNPKFANVLQTIGIEPPTKISKTTSKPTFAFAKTDDGMKALLEHEHPLVQLLASVRLSTKSTIDESRLEKFIGLAPQGPLGMPYKISGVHLHRLSGNENINVQNLPSGRVKGQSKAMRQSIKAPDDHIVIAADSSQVEARVLAYIAQQQDLLQQFRDGADVYCTMASRIYGRSADEILAGHKAEDPVSKLQRQMGKNARLGAGFGIGKDRFKDYVREQTGIVIPIEEAEKVITAFRQSNQQIVQSWRIGDQVLKALMAGQSGTFGGPTGDLFFYDGARQWFGHTTPGVRGPDGVWLNYPELRIEQQEEIDKETGEIKMRDVIVFTQTKGRSKMRAYVYGAKLIQNCIAVGTPVLTNRGWVAIEHVSVLDRVHDGIEFVRHGGLVFKGHQPCVVVDGVIMTPDHEVLTNDGWETASQSPRPYRPDLRLVDGATLRWQRRKSGDLAVPMPLRHRSGPAGEACDQDGQSGHDPELRMFHGASQDTRHVQAPSLRGVGQHEGALHQPEPPRLAQLWRAGYYGLRAMARQLRDVLGGHEPQLCTGPRPGPHQQRAGVLNGELPLGTAKSERAQQARLRRSGHSDAVSGHRDRQVDAALAVGSGVAVDGPREVVDITNCGPRQRFVVAGERGPVVVHNCTQYLAFATMKYQANLIGKRTPVKMNVHDEFAAVVPVPQANELRAYMDTCMRTVPPWLQGCPITCETGMAARYGDC